jgi:hypothetical protein
MNERPHRLVSPFLNVSVEKTSGGVRGFSIRADSGQRATVQADVIAGRLSERLAGKALVTVTVTPKPKHATADEDVWEAFYEGVPPGYDGPTSLEDRAEGSLFVLSQFGSKLKK